MHNYREDKKGTGKEIIVFLALFCLIHSNSAVAFAQQDNLKEAVTIYKDDSLFGLMDASGQSSTQAIYTELHSFKDGIFVAARKGKFSNRLFYGLINAKGKTKLPFLYNNLKSGGDYLVAVKKKKQDYLFGIIDEKGKIVLNFNYYSIKPLGQNIFLIKDTALQQQIIRIDRQPNVIIDAVSSADSIKHDLIVYNKGGRYGLIQANGERLTSARYKSIKVESKNSIRIEEFSKWEFISLNKERKKSYQADSAFRIAPNKIALLYNEYTHIVDTEDSASTRIYKGILADVFTQKYLILSDRDGFKLYNMAGKALESNFFAYIKSEKFLQLSKVKYDKTEHSIFTTFGERFKADSFKIEHMHIQFKQDGYWGVLNTKLEEIIPPIYNQIESIEAKQQFIVNFRDRYGVIDQENNWVISPIYIKLEYWDKYGYWCVNNILREFIIDEDKQIEASLHFVHQKNQVIESSLDNRLRIVNTDLSFSALKLNGQIKQINPPILLLKKNSQWRLANLKTISSSEYFEADTVALGPDNYHIIKRNRSFGLINSSGKLLIANRYDSIIPFREGLAAIKIRSGWGFIDEKENLVIQPYYEEVGTFHQNLAIVKASNGFGIINKAGKTIIKEEYSNITRSNNFYLLRKGEQEGVANSSGKIIFFPSFDKISFINDRIKTKQYGEEKLYSKNGKLLINSNYHKIYATKDKNTFLTKINSRFRFISRNEITP